MTFPVCSTCDCRDCVYLRVCDLCRECDGAKVGCLARKAAK